MFIDKILSFIGVSFSFLKVFQRVVRFCHSRGLTWKSRLKNLLSIADLRVGILLTERERIILFFAFSENVIKYKGI